ncbi:MAG: hypothetical protein GY714_18795 [Desulfobacterales bacterium]|nr:hypothetical protein [Desulfobacterales bacterium]
MFKNKLLLVILLSAALAFNSCTGKKAEKPDQKQKGTANFVEMEFPKGRYLTATGSGDSQSEASRNAKSEISNIFEAKISSDLSSNTTSIVDTKAGDSMKKIVRRNINVQSSVKLKGLTIGKTWKDGGQHYAVAVLEKAKAKDQWFSDIEQVDNKIDAQFKVVEKQVSKVTKLKPLKNIVNLWLKKQAIISRLRVIGYAAPSANKHNIKSVFEQIPAIKADINIYVTVKGLRAQEIRDIVSKYLTKANFKFTGFSKKADVIIYGKSKAERVRNNNRDFVFARAKLFLSIYDVKTKVKIAEIAEDTRKGALTINEAAHKAIKGVSKKAAQKVVEYFD